MGEVTSIQVPEKVINEIVKAEITTQVMKAMSGSDELIRKIVSGALALKVDEKGNPSCYSSAVPFLDRVLQDTIRDAAKSAIQEYVKSAEGQIKKAIEAEMKKNTKSLVQAFTRTILETTGSSYRLNVSVSPKPE